MIAAGRAAERGLKVLLLEKNKKLGEKLRISGGGRCNITNAERDSRLLLEKYGEAEQFLYSLFVQFGVADTFVFFESRGLPLIVEANNRVFPKSQQATDVVDILATYLDTGNVTVCLKSPVTKVVHGVEGITSVISGDKEYFGKEFILATGGVSHPETGSTGDGWKWLNELGHTVKEPSPTIVPIRVKETWVKELAGVSLEEMKITFFSDSKKAFSLSGKILFTHFGLSGPLILNNAQKVSDLLHSGVVTAKIDVFPKVPIEDLERKVIAIFDENKNKELKNILKEIVPVGYHKGVQLLLETIAIDGGAKVNIIKKEERKRLVQLLKGAPLTVLGLMGFDRAVLADGGIPLGEIDVRTMRSKKVSNLFITGDLLHINRPSGGYSLQLCWSTGYVAGSKICQTKILHDR
jgi:predicted Rossmann fold flavoprotein